MQTQDITTIQKIRAFPWYFGSSAATVVFILLSWFGPVLPLFLNALSLSKTQIGFILAIPFLCAPLSLLVSRWILRWGAKRTLLWCFGFRALITGGLCAAPVLLAWAGAPVVFAWVVAISLGFSMCRAIGETGFLSWSREFIPNHLRGKTDSVNSIVSGLCSVTILLLAAWFLKHVTGLRGYSLLTVASLPFGILSVIAFMMIPGGQPVQVEPGRHGFIRDCLEVLKDGNFRNFEIGCGLYSLSASAFVFLPLFLDGQIGLGAGNVMVLSACFWVGLLVSSFLWGWSADRFGSKPVLLTGLLLVMLMPFWLFLMPRASAWSLRAAIAAYVFYGVAIQGLNAGVNRYFFVSVIPASNRNSAYDSIHYTWSGLLTALGPILAGSLLDRFLSLSGTWRFIHVDPFTPLFASILSLFLAAFYWFRRLRKDGPMQQGEFMYMFIQGNPIMAFNSMIRYRFADNEAERVTTTRNMGDAENPLSVAELLEAITDPSFNVRYEAILAMVRMPSHPQLTQALMAVLDSEEPDLSEAAGWALGRIGDQKAIPGLRRALTSRYALLRSRSARSLANLGDAASVPLLCELLKSEKHDGIRVAYASALGVFRAGEALDDLLALLRRASTQSPRGEVSLALARIIGSENHFVRLWRSTRSDFGTNCAQAVSVLRRRIAAEWPASAPRDESLDSAEHSLAVQDLAHGAEALARLIGCLPLDKMEPHLAALLAECGRQLPSSGPDRREYVLLALTAVHTAVAVL